MEKGGEQSLRPTGVFKNYKEVFGDETHLFTEPGELNEVNDKLPDEQTRITWEIRF